MKWSAEDCRARAEEVEALARTVAYDKDRVRLNEQARSWRDQAARVDAREAFWRDPEPAAGGLWGWLRRR